MDIKEYFTPKSVKEALEILKEGKGRFIPVSGGTSFAFGRPPQVEGLVDLNRCGIDYVKEKKQAICLGAATPVIHFQKHSILNNYMGGVMPEAALSIATSPLRHVITAGGNCMQIFLWSGLPPLFLSLGAKFKIQGKKKETITADNFFKTQPRRRVENTSLLTEIILPPDNGAGAAYVKFARSKTDFALMSVAAFLYAEDGVCEKARIAVGSLSPLPTRLFEAEEILLNSELNVENIERAAKAGAESMKPMKDFRTRDHFKKKVAPVMIRRCLELAAERALSKN